MVDKLIDKNFCTSNTNPVGEVGVKFVRVDCDGIRGFSGLNNIYINETHFVRKYGGNQSDLRTFGEIDIVTITIHEFAHTRLRQVCAELKLIDILIICCIVFISESQ